MQTSNTDLQEQETLDDEALVGRLADEFSEQLAAGNPVDLEEYRKRYPELDDVLEDVYQSVRSLQEIEQGLSRRGVDGGNGEFHDGGDLDGRRLGDFCVVRAIGRGGMGVVYQAEQVSLRRKVALKILPLASVLDKRQLARFQNEARAAATLNHPNIVPVYYVGSDRGVHYFAMQLIEGQSLAELIQKMRIAAPRGYPGLRNKEGVEPSDSAIPNPQSAIETTAAALSTTRFTKPMQYFRAVADVAATIADALEHAHEQGVVHRDVKPGNILLDGRGKAWITDFGLAHLEGDISTTTTGDLVGTVRYMSPEQATGKRASIDHRTDIYSLGVTLYELLALRPAFEGENREELLRRVASEAPPLLRRLNSEIPVELDTIIRKASEKDPADRYASANELADDLRCFLSHKPIRARRPSPAVRMAKWARRHRAVVWSACGAACISIAVLVTSLVLLRQAYLSERAQRERAEQNAVFARDAVDEMYQEVALRWLSDDADLTAIQRDLLQKALKIYQQLADQPAIGTDWQSGQAKLYKRMGRIHFRLSNYEEAKSAYERSIRLYQELLAKSPAEQVYLDVMETAYNELGLVYKSMGNLAAGRRMLRLAREKLEEMSRRFPDQLEYRHRIAVNDLNMSTSLQSAGQIEEAETHIRRAREVYAQLKEESPNLPMYRQLFATCSGQLCDVLITQHQYDEAIDICREGLAECRRAKMELPDDPEIAPLEANLTSELGTVLQLVGKLEESEKELRRALDLWQPICLSYAFGPMVPEHVEQSADTMIELGRTLIAAGKFEEAEKELRRGVDYAVAIGVDYPKVPGFRSTAAVGYHALAGMLKRHRPSDAPAEFERLVEVRRELAEQYPEHPSYHGELGAALHDWALLLGNQGRLQEARDLYVEAIDWQRRARELAPAVPRYRENLRKHHTRLVHTLVGLGDHEAAAAAAEDFVSEVVTESCVVCFAAEMLAKCMTLARDDVSLDEGERERRVADYRDRCRAILSPPADGTIRADWCNSVAWFLATTPEQSLRDPDRAVELAQTAVELEPKDGNHWNTLGAAHYRAGNWKDAIAALDESVTLQGGGNAYDFLFLAMAHWQLDKPFYAKNWLEEARADMAGDGDGDVSRAADDLLALRTEAEDLIVATSE